MNASDLMRGLPGERLIQQGIEDFVAGLDTVAACLVGIAQTRLRRTGLIPPSVPRDLPDAELQLYRRLRQQEGDAYSRYNSLIRELVSFEQALDRRFRQASES
jgi:hypothetical protein